MNLFKRLSFFSFLLQLNLQRVVYVTENPTLFYLVFKLFLLYHRFIKFLFAIDQAIIFNFRLNLFIFQYDFINYFGKFVTSLLLINNNYWFLLQRSDFTRHYQSFQIFIKFRKIYFDFLLLFMSSRLYFQYKTIIFLSIKWPWTYFLFFHFIIINLLKYILLHQLS